jgi:hypothetical protein
VQSSSYKLTCKESSYQYWEGDELPANSAKQAQGNYKGNWKMN